MGQSKKQTKWDPLLQEVTPEDMENLRRFVESLQKSIQKKSQIKTKPRRRKPERKKRIKKEVDWRIQDLPFHF